MSVGVARFLGGLITFFKFLSWHKPAGTSRAKGTVPSPPSLLAPPRPSNARLNQPGFWYSPGLDG